MTPIKKAMRRAAIALLPEIPETEEQLRKSAAEAAKTAYRANILQEEMDAKVTEVTEKLGGEIMRLKKRYGKIVGGIQTWAHRHRDRFSGRKSLVIDGHDLSFRMGNGKLVNSDSDDNLIQRIFASGDDDLIDASIDLKPSIDKVTIKAALSAGGPMAEQLTALGFSIEKVEGFTFKPASVTGSES